MCLLWSQLECSREMSSCRPRDEEQRESVSEHKEAEMKMVFLIDFQEAGLCGAALLSPRGRQQAGTNAIKNVFLDTRFLWKRERESWECCWKSAPRWALLIKLSYTASIFYDARSSTGNLSISASDGAQPTTCSLSSSSSSSSILPSALSLCSWHLHQCSPCRRHSLQELVLSVLVVNGTENKQIYTNVYILIVSLPRPVLHFLFWIVNWIVPWN